MILSNNDLAQVTNIRTNTLDIPQKNINNLLTYLLYGAESFLRS